MILQRWPNNLRCSLSWKTRGKTFLNVSPPLSTFGPSASNLMGRFSLTTPRCLLLTLCLLVVASAGADQRANKSSAGGILWATAKDESDILSVMNSDDDSIVDGASDEFTGGFSSLEGMLQWAIGHSDVEKLKEKANDARRLSLAELKQRQLEIKELMEKLKMPSDAELLKVAIDDLNNLSLSSEDRQRALNELLILVESVDNANDFDKLGGLVVVQELQNSDSEIRTTAAWILGIASQNDALIQNKILALGGLIKLIKMVKSNSTEEALKALFALSALIRNNDEGQELFYSENGYLLLQDIMSKVGIDSRLQKKAAILVADLADYQKQYTSGSTHSSISDRLFMKSVVDLTLSDDIGLQEKALMAIKSLLLLPSTDALDLKDFCELEKVLESLKEKLEGMMEDRDEYVEELESLRREIQLLFHEKLDKVSWVPT